MSASSETVARRVIAMLGFGDDPRMQSFAGRIERRDELEARMREWCAARTRDEAMGELERADAAAGPVNDMADVDADPHVRARNLISEVGATPMQGLIASLSATPGRLDWEGRPLDADRDEIVARGWLDSGE